MMMFQTVPSLSRLSIAVLMAAASVGADAKPSDQGKLGLGLEKLVAQSEGRLAAESPAVRSLAVRDEAGRVRVDIHLDGKVALDQLRAVAEQLGARVLHASASYRHGVITALIPLDLASRLAGAQGVKSVLVAPDPITNAGKIDGQGLASMHVNRVHKQAGVTGKGVTIGALSDSYNKSRVARIKAPDDIADGELPGRGNPDGYTTPVEVIQDGTLLNSDEGRAMLQIVHDVAPAAKKCFATAYPSQANFADNIRKLADPDGPCKAQVIVDDIIYWTEPMFSDGIVAQAVDEVAAKGVAYFSSAGNRDSYMGYLKTFNPYANAAARADSKQTVKLSVIPKADTKGGFHNHASGGAKEDIARTITFAADSTLVMQWNDPFDANAVTTDYDLYAFDESGNKVVGSSTDDNFATDQPIEAIQLKAGTYQIVVASANAASAQPVADQIRMVTFGAVASGEYLSFDTPITFGHNSAARGNGVAAVPFYQDYTPEYFTSPGPSFIYFDAKGKRLAQPERRKKPNFAAPDGVNTSFFGGDTAEDADKLPNFFGTSAAAPHAAAVAALVLEAAGGPGSLTAAQMSDVLQQTAGKHDLRWGHVQGIAKADKARVAVSVDGSDLYGFSTKTFSISMKAPAGYSLQELTIDLSKANAQRVFLGTPAPGLQFDPRTDVGFPFTIGELVGLKASDISTSPLSKVAPFSQQLRLKFADGKFTSGDRIAFGVDRDETATGGGGYLSDLVHGARFAGVIKGPNEKTIRFDGEIDNTLKNDWMPVVGYGLIDADKAVKHVQR